MANTLFEIWRDQGEFVEAKSFRQIIQLAGDGRLRDGNATSAELREWLTAVSLDRLRGNVEECLADSFDDAALALQDSTNEIGTRLGFKVARGRYRGVKGEVGNDGLWNAEDGFSLLVEVKTSDAYRINLDVIAGYRNSLIKSGSIDPERSSILIAVGRQETGDLEAQIRGSQHAWDIRLISLEALLRLAEVKEELSDWATSKKINLLLRPVEYTRLDEIVELLFAAKKDLSTPDSIAPPSEISQPIVTSKVSANELEDARDATIQKIANRFSCTFLKRGRAARISSDGSTRLVCVASQRYEGPAGAGNYWFGFTPAQRDFLSEGEQSWVSLVCVDSRRSFLIPWNQFKGWLTDFWTSPANPVNGEEVRHWHIYFNDYQNRVELMKSGGGLLLDLSTFLLP